MRTLDPNDSQRPYLQVADAIRGAITAGEWAPGERIPSRPQLARHFGLAPMTIQGALDLLHSEQLLVSRQGQGTYVRTDAPPQRPDIHAELADLRERVTRLEQHIAKQEEQQP